jgi:hypothetical protein
MNSQHPIAQDEPTTSPNTEEQPVTRREAPSTPNEEPPIVQDEPATSTGMERRYSIETQIMEEQAPPMVLVTFRKDRLLVSDPEEFHNGIVCGQTALIDGGEPANEKWLFRLFAEGVSDIELSESWLVGHYLGIADALLRGRKTFPPEMPDWKDR